MKTTARARVIQVVWLIPLIMVVIGTWADVGTAFRVLTWMALAIGLAAAVLEWLGQRRRGRSTAAPEEAEA